MRHDNTGAAVAATHKIEGRNSPAVIALATWICLALTGPVLAQDTGAPPGGFGGGPGGPPPDGFGGGQGTGNVNPARGFGGPNQGAAPFVGGIVTAVDADAGTLTVTAQGSASRTIKVAPDAQITTQQSIQVSDLKVGDKISVRGVPSGLTASLLTAGQPPAGLPGAGGFSGGRAGGNNGGGNASSTESGTSAVQSFATASGTIKTLPSKTDAHLALTLGQDAILYLKIAEGAKFTRYTTVALSGIKAGDRLVAMGQTGDDGVLTASIIGVNLTSGGPAGGGFGGPGGDHAPPVSP